MFTTSREEERFRMNRKVEEMGEATSRLSLEHFCKSIMKICEPKYLRRATIIDIEKLYAHHELKHEFSGMSNNDINFLHQSPLLNDPKQGKPPDNSFVANVDHKEAISPNRYPEESHLPDDLLRSDKQRRGTHATGGIKEMVSTKEEDGNGMLFVNDMLTNTLASGVAEENRLKPVNRTWKLARYDFTP
ncbi:hypothetical protein Tco_0173205 [Tanacetum coccineum]